MHRVYIWKADLKTTWLRWIRQAVFLPAITAAAALSGCVQSETPLIHNAKPLLGETFQAHFYRDFSDGKASNEYSATYRWTGRDYERVAGKQAQVARFVGEPLAGDDYVVQGTDDEGRLYGYWLARKIFDGTYLIAPLDEMKADDATRDLHCRKPVTMGVCVINSAQALTALAKATAQKPLHNPTLGVLILRRETM